MQSPTTIWAVGTVAERGPGGSRGPDSEGDRDGEGDIDKPGDIDGPGDIGGGSAGLARIAFGGAAPSACTTVGAAELRELGSSRSWVCEPPGFIAAESSRA